MSDQENHLDHHLLSFINCLFQAYRVLLVTMVLEDYVASG